MSALRLRFSIWKLTSIEQAMVRSTTNGAATPQILWLIGTFDDFRFELRQEFREAF